MSGTVRLSRFAAGDIAEAHAWYQRAELGLGQKFLDSIEKTLDRNAQAALQFPLAVRDTRRALVPRFPYAIYFKITNEEIRVIAVLHQLRDPSLVQRRTR